MVENLSNSFEKEVSALFLSDDYDGLLSAYRSTITDAQKRKTFFKVFDEVMYFLEDAPNRRISSMAKVRIRLITGGKVKRRLMEETGGDLNGVTLKNSKLDQYAILLPDASNAGKYRASFFDKRGFIYHITLDTYEAVLDEVFECGFMEAAPDALERLFNSKEWLNWYGGRGEALR